MARILPKKDVVIIGLGWTGAVMAQELTDEGLDVIAIERGPWRDAPTDFPPSQMQDELRYRVRHELFLRPDQLTFTLRNKLDQQALPIRNWGAFMPPNGVGGGGVHWNAEMWRFLPSDFVLKTHLTQRYGADFLPADMTIQDWGITYDELEPYYDRFEYLCGTSGTAGNLRGQIMEGGNPFEGPRSRDYPTKAQAQPFSHTLFGKAARELGQPVDRLHESARAPDGPVHVLRILRMVRLQQLFEGKPPDHAPSGARPQVQLHGPRQFGSGEDQYGPVRKARDGRDFRRQQRRGVGTASGSRHPIRILGVQRATDAAFEHRTTIRSCDWRGPDRAQFHPSDDLIGERLLRSHQVQLQSVHRIRLDRHVHRRI
jgi:choline dehydrogenase-like flavoprotein